jgi:hypothetical protein
MQDLTNSCKPFSREEEVIAHRERDRKLERGRIIFIEVRLSSVSQL